MSNLANKDINKEVVLFILLFVTSFWESIDAVLTCRLLIGPIKISSKSVQQPLGLKKTDKNIISTIYTSCVYCHLRQGQSQ